jgi:hypothetical protein
LDIKTVEIEGTQISSEKVFEPATFAEILGIEELRARRAAVVRAIDQSLSEIGQSHPNYAYRKSYESRKFMLLTREERLENEFNRNKIAVVSSHFQKSQKIEHSFSYFSLANIVLYNSVLTLTYRNMKYQNDRLTV